MTPEFDWALDVFGGRNIKQDFKHMTNIIFSNGDLDPWHSGGVLYNITSSNKDIFTSLYIPMSAHHFDLRLPNALDPDVVT